MKTGHKSIIAVVFSQHKDANGESISCFGIDWQFLDANPINVGVEVYLYGRDGQSFRPEIVEELLMMAQPHIVGGTHVAALL